MVEVPVHRLFYMNLGMYQNKLWAVDHTGRVIL